MSRGREGVKFNTLNYIYETGQEKMTGQWQVFDYLDFGGEFRKQY